MLIYYYVLSTLDLSLLNFLFICYPNLVLFYFYFSDESMLIDKIVKEVLQKLSNKYPPNGFKRPDWY